MSTVVVYESLFGNTELLAREVAAGLARDLGPALVREVGLVRPEDLRACNLLVLGAPTHAFSLSRPATREDAVTKGADPQHATTGLREWLDTLDEVFTSRDRRPRIAVFDTRIDRMRHLPGSAARRAERVLRRHGFEVLDRESFYVTDIDGPPATGEQERARAWGARLLDGSGTADGTRVS